MRYLLLLLIFCSGCVTTSRCSLTCNKTIDLDNRPIDGKINVGVRLELLETTQDNVIYIFCGRIYILNFKGH